MPPFNSARTVKQSFDQKHNILLSTKTLMEEPLKQDTLQDYQERMLRVLIYIQNHLDHGPTLNELAELAHFSPFHFHRIFRGMVGESLKAYVRRLRLE